MSQFDPQDKNTQRNHILPGSAPSFTCGAQPGLSKRRNFLQMAMGGAAGLLTAAGMELMAPSSARAQSQLTPEMALRELIAGNRRYVAGRLRSFELDLAILRHHTSELQQPFAALLSCADSRVPVELVFDQAIGQIFVTRIAGNIANSEIIASLEYGAAVLGTKVILVMGHGDCGAVKAAIEGKEAPGQISALYPHLQPALDLAGPDLEGTTKANAKIQAALIRKASTVISSMVKAGQLIVLPAFYNISSGVVSLLERPGDDNPV